MLIFSFIDTFHTWVTEHHALIVEVPLGLHVEVNYGYGAQMSSTCDMAKKAETANLQNCRLSIFL